MNGCFAFMALPVFGPCRFSSRACMLHVPHLSPKIDLMVLYSGKAWSPDGYDYTEPVLLNMIAEAIAGTNQALIKSDVDLEINLVHVGQVSAGVEQAMPRGM